LASKKALSDEWEYRYEKLETGIAPSMQLRIEVFWSGESMSRAEAAVTAAAASPFFQITRFRKSILIIMSGHPQ